MTTPHAAHGLTDEAIDGLSDDELHAELDRRRGCHVIPVYCCPDGGNCDYREFCLLGTPGGVAKPMTYREVLLKLLRSPGPT